MNIREGVELRDISYRGEFSFSIDGIEFSIRKSSGWYGNGTWYLDIFNNAFNCVYRSTVKSAINAIFDRSQPDIKILMKILSVQSFRTRSRNFRDLVEGKIKVSEVLKSVFYTLCQYPPVWSYNYERIKKMKEFLDLIEHRHGDNKECIKWLKKIRSKRRELVED